MSEAKTFNTPRDFASLEDDAEIGVKQGGLIGYVSPEEVSKKLLGGSMVTGSGSTAGGTGASVAFAEAFDAAPLVFVSVVGTAGFAHASNVTAAGFDVDILDAGGLAINTGFNWIAIG